MPEIVHIADGIHFTDALLSTIFSGIAGFAVWSGKRLIAHDTKLAEIAVQMRIIAKHLLPVEDESDASYSDFLNRRRIKYRRLP